MGYRINGCYLFYGLILKSRDADGTGTEVSLVTYLNERNLRLYVSGLVVRPLIRKKNVHQPIGSPC